MQDQSVGLKEVISLGYNVIATVYHTDTFKPGIKFDNNGKILIIHDGRVICSFHAEKSETDEGEAAASFNMKEYEG